MSVALIPFSTFSASAAKSGKVGDCSWRLEGTVLTISGEGSMGEHLKSRPWGDKITEVIVDEGVTSICSNAFYMCKSLRKITLPSTLLIIEDYAFWGCENLESITIPDGVTNIGNSAFDSCQKLTNIYIPKSVVSISDSCFRDCDRLGSIVVDEQNHNYCSIDGVLFSKDKTVLIKYPAFKYENVISSYTVPDTVTTIEGNAFYDAYYLYDIKLPAGITSLSSYSFYKCGVRVVAKQNGDDICYIGEYLIGVLDKGKSTYKIKEGTRVIADSAFNGCKRLKKLAVPDGVEYIGQNAFSFCSSLTVLSLPNSLKEIATFAVVDTPIQNIYFRGSEKERNQINISEANKELKRATWHFDACYGSEKHIWGSQEIIKAASCSAEGLKEQICNVCGAVKMAVIPAAEHEYGLISQATAASCTSVGLEIAICTVCDYHVQRYIEPTGHIFGAWREEIAPTCTEIGIMKRYCAMCDVSEAQIINATGHDYDVFNIIKEATVSEEGYKAAACMVCGDIKTEVIPRDNVRGVISVWQMITVGIGVVAFTSIVALLVVIAKKNKKLRED